MSQPFGDPGSSNPFSGSNPYQSPSYSPSQFGSPPPVDPRETVRGRVMAPAIVLVVISALGLATSIFNVVFAFGEPQIDPNDPPFVRQMKESSTGPVALTAQSAFVVVNLLIIGGAVQMMRFKTWGFALAASIIAMLNFGTFCCVLGLPVGIWSLVILLQPDVKQAFAFSDRAMY
jgi:hypothetical protein